MHKDTLAPDQPDNGIFTPSEAIRSTFAKLAEYIHPDISINPSIETMHILHDFAGELVNPRLYDVAMLAPIAERLTDIFTSRPARRALVKYRDQFSEGSEDYAYVTDILSDFLLIKKHEEHAIAEWSSEKNEADKSVREALESYKHTPIERRVWGTYPRLGRFDELLDLTENTNVETMLVKSAQQLQLLGTALENIRKGESVNDRQILTSIYLTESMYAPFCEATGFDALASGLLSTCYLIRAEKLGRHDDVVEAQEVLASIGNDDDVDSLLVSLPDKILGDSIQERVTDDSSGHEVLFNTGYIQIHDNVPDDEPPIDARIVMRKKSLGSLWRKMSKEGRVPADIIGITVITPEIMRIDNPEEVDLDKTRVNVGQVFAGLLKQLQTHASTETLLFTKAPSRNEEINLKGSREFINTIKAAIRSYQGSLAIEEDEHDGGYEAAKATFVWRYHDSEGVDREVPIEIQIHHEISRKESRIGVDSHLLYKFFKFGGSGMSREDAASHIASLHERKMLLSPSTLARNGASRSRGETLRLQIEREAGITDQELGRVAIRPRASSQDTELPASTVSR